MTRGIKQSDRAFGLMFSVVFSIVVCVGYFVFDAIVTWAIVAAGAFLACALIAPWVLLPLNRLWSLFALRLGHFNNYLLLGTFFYVFVLPAGLIMRLFTDPMRRKLDRDSPSYWTPVDRKASADTYRDLF